MSCDSIVLEVRYHKISFVIEADDTVTYPCDRLRSEFVRTYTMIYNLIKGMT